MLRLGRADCDAERGGRQCDADSQQYFDSPHAPRLDGCGDYSTRKTGPRGVKGRVAPPTRSPCRSEGHTAAVAGVEFPRVVRVVAPYGVA